uniref:Uncharacterized protein n=1 Tax=Rhizophora mucronata TaxID=61149 RepID=A0A2P2QUB1_RHIMU
MMNLEIQFGRIVSRAGRIKRTRRKMLHPRLRKSQLKFHLSSRWKRNRQQRLHSHFQLSFQFHATNSPHTEL